MCPLDQTRSVGPARPHQAGLVGEHAELSSVASAELHHRVIDVRLDGRREGEPRLIRGKLSFTDAAGLGLSYEGDPEALAATDPSKPA